MWINTDIAKLNFGNGYCVLPFYTLTDSSN